MDLLTCALNLKMASFLKGILMYINPHFNTRVHVYNAYLFTQKTLHELNRPCAIGMIRRRKTLGKTKIS